MGHQITPAYTYILFNDGPPYYSCLYIYIIQWWAPLLLQIIHRYYTMMGPFNIGPYYYTHGNDYNIVKALNPSKAMGNESIISEGIPTNL